MNRAPAHVPPGATAGSGSAAGPGGGGLRILCADDTRACRRLMEIVLARAGHAVTCVEDGQRAHDLFAADPWGFDVVVTDHHMPGLDGLGLVGKLRAAGFAGGIIVVSAGIDATEAARYRSLNVNRILLKPIFAEQVHEAVNEIRRV